MTNNCQQCGKEFNFFSCYRYSCVACGGSFCLTCLNHLVNLTPSDVIPPALRRNIRDYSRPQKTCGSCHTRVLNRQAHGMEVDQTNHDNYAHSPLSPPPNRSIQEGYTFGEKLGEGGFGLVKEATNKQTGNVVAIKIINRAKLGKPEEASVLSEANILKSLHHPNIVKLYEFYTESQHYYMVMEKVMGGELFDRIVEKTHYTEREARDLVTLILHAIKYCHDRDIVHRDLKPENLLLTSHSDNADIKLVDFGFATEAKGFSLTDQCGTPAYVAPEILYSQPYGKPVDMWSFGVILYILLVGYPPFFDSDQQVLFRKIMKGSFEFHAAHWRHVSFAAKNLISGLLTVNPTKRFTVDDALAHEWLQHGSHELGQKPLTEGLSQLKKFQAAKKFKAGVKAVVAAGRLKRSLSQIAHGAISPKAAAATTTLPHTIAARYSLGKVLGEGGYAVVKLGINNLTKDEVAVKVFKVAKMTMNQVKGLQEEVAIMQKLIGHPNIVKFYDFFEEPEMSYLVMEKINGGELFDRIIRKQHYNEKEAQQLARILLNAIKHMHDYNIVHRDLKPENLLMTSESNDADVKVVDFGFAAAVNGYSLDKYCGTPGYMAPEIIRRQLYGKPVDMWAFGVILYILIGGYPPFYDKNDSLLAQKICRGRFEFHVDCWSHVSNDAKDLIVHLLIVNPEARYSVEDALRHPWLQEDEMILEERELSRGLTELRKFQARRKLRIGLKAVLAVSRVKLLVEKHRAAVMDVDRNSFQNLLAPRSSRPSHPYEDDFAMDVDDHHDTVPPPAPQLYSNLPPLPPK